MFGREQAERLTLYGSRPSTLRLAGELSDVVLPVEPLSSLATTSVSDDDALIWYAFLLHNKVGDVGLDAYRRANDEIARIVFQTLERNPGLQCVFASSGTALEQDNLPPYELDPYSHLKVTYEERLRVVTDASVVYPYASTGMYLPDPHKFALGSFVHQALTSGRIVIDATVPVVRSYGSVHDLSRYLLTVLDAGVRLPLSIVPVNSTVDLLQLAIEVCAALDVEPDIASRLDGGPPNVYVAKTFEYVHQLAAAGLTPTALANQIRLTAQGPAFRT
jgi:hypothetical protein